MSENAQVEKNNTEVDQEKKAFTTGLSEWSNTITNLIERDYDSCGVKFDDYSKKCALEAMTSIYNLVRTNPKVNMGSLDTSNLRGIVVPVHRGNNFFPRIRFCSVFCLILSLIDQLLCIDIIHFVKD